MNIIFTLFPHKHTGVSYLSERKIFRAFFRADSIGVTVHSLKDTAKMMTYTLHYFLVHFDIEMTRRPYGNAAFIASNLFGFCDLGFDLFPSQPFRPWPI
jgi:hypothetical protein